MFIKRNLNKHVVVICGLLCLSLNAGCKSEPQRPPASATAPATRPATTPDTAPATEPAAKTYLDVIRDIYPALPATQPLDVPVSLREAAHLVLKDPVFLDEQGHLWITRSDGADAGTEARTAGESSHNEHVVREEVLFAWWLPDQSGGFAPRIVTRSDAGTPEMIVPSRLLPMGARDDYRWDRARSWVDQDEQRLIVPTRQGVSVFTFDSDREPIVEAHQDLTTMGQPATLQGTSQEISPATAASAPSGDASGEPPQFLFDPRGVIAWIPAAPGKPGSAGAARFLNGKWIVLTPDAGWPDRILHLIPLRDGSVTQLLLKSGDGGARVKLALASVEAPSVKKDVIIALVDQLSDIDKDIRDAAYGRLTEYGPGVWPILREIPPDDLPPEARSRLNRLLRSQVTPMIGGMALQGDQLELVQRLRDGGAVFYTDQGINLPNPFADEPISHAPAWIAARPGRPVEMLRGALVFNADPKRTKFDMVQGQWVLTMDDSGPQQFLGNSFRPLLRKESRTYSEVIGIDRRGRWLFRKPANKDAAEAGTDNAASTSVPETLIVDPTLPDFTPRLPVWLYTNAEETGWDKEGWPAVRLGQLRARLVADRWASLGETDEILVEPPESPAPPDNNPPAAKPTATMPSAKPPATAALSTVPATSLATRPVISSDRLAALGTPLLTDPAGNRYFGGVTDLKRVSADGVETQWTLPGEAVGEAPATLISAGDGRLFLFNRVGRVLRIKPINEPSEPFLLEATFTKDIPEEPPTRIWLDPAGRIIMAYERRLAILFPQGFIPRPIRLMMDLPEDDAEE